MPLPRTALRLFRPSLTPMLVGARLPSSQRHLVVSASRLGSAGVKEKAAASANNASRFAVPSQTQADSADAGDVVPLSRQVYESMPSTMRNLSVMGKVVLITG